MASENFESVESSYAAESDYKEDEYRVTPGQAHHSQARKYAKQRPGLPTVAEAIQLEELSHFWDQMKQFIDELAKDKEDLQLTFDQRKAELSEQFENLQALLAQREEKMLEQLTTAWEQRDTKLETQIDALEKHLENNEATEDACRELLQEMNQRGQRSERTQKITNLCQSCINQSPTTQKVPIDLKYTFSTRAATTKNISEFGKLKMRPIQSGKAMKLTKKNKTVSDHPAPIHDLPKKPLNETSGEPDILEDGPLSMENEEKCIGNGHAAADALQLPDKLKIKCVIDCGDENGNKTINKTLKKEKNEISFDFLRSEIHKAAARKVKELGEDAMFEIVIGDKYQIYDQDSFVYACVTEQEVEKNDKNGTTSISVTGMTARLER